MSPASEIPQDSSNFGSNGNWRGSCNHRGFKGEGFRKCGGNPFELVAMILGFIVFWPLGLAILFWRMMRRNNGQMPFAHFGQWQSNWNGAQNWRGFAQTGNSAFDDWKAAELTRLEEERRKLAEAQAAFAEHLSNLRKAKDRAQFDEFMAAYRAKPTE